MEQTTTQPTQQPQGKGMGVAGFVISLVALIGYFPIALVVGAQALMGGGYGLGITWTVITLSGTLLSVMGMMKLGKTGGKRGLAITGMILGILALIACVRLVIGIGELQAAGGIIGDGFKESLQNIK